MKLYNRGYIVAIAKKKKQTHRVDDLFFETIPNGMDYWVADPFPFEYQGNLYVFGEMYEYKTLKGCIAYCKLENNRFTPWKKIIEESYHLSFPNIFEDNGKLYICPETKQLGQLYFYKCLEFPEKWEKDRVLANNVNYCDTVFWNKDQETYGFSCEWNSLRDHRLSVYKIENGNLLYLNEHGEMLENYKSRPAGKIFHDEEECCDLMVSQICSPLYGSGLVFKKFNINNMIYSETELSQVMPRDIHCNKRKHYDGIHTFNMSENYVAIDLLWTRFNIVEKGHRLLKKIMRGI